MTQVQEKFRELLKLLDEVEDLILSYPDTVDKEESLDLADRFYEVAETIYDKFTFRDSSDSDTGDEGAPLDLQQPKQQDTHSGTLVLPGFRPTPPVITLSDSSDEDHDSKPFRSSTPLSASMVSVGSTQQSASVAAYKRLGQPTRYELDEPLRKRRREAEELVKSLDRPKTFTCGISYTGDSQEKDFSDNAKQDIRAALPALKTHRHLFRYMVWATLERLKCDHCRQCTNTFKSQ